MIQIRYFPGNTFIHRLDARSKFFLIILYVFLEVAFRDIRILILPLAFSIALYLAARIPFKEVRSTWRFLVIVVGVISSVNILFTLVGTSVTSPHIVARFWVFTVTQEGLSLAAAAAVKLLALATVTLTSVLTTNPSDYAPALAKLKTPYKVAFVFDLALRYVPTYADELETTLNAQMARGYKPRGGKGIVSRIVNTVPLIVPVAISAMLSIYDISDAMELRGFGAKKQRTWYRELRFGRLDYVAIPTIAALLATSIYLRMLFPGYWIPG